ncbi:MAG: shikimate kinase [Ignavibacteriales bacterium]|nr:shikimate kinase [Ignavibacteriales bacterium]
MPTNILFLTGFMGSGKSRLGAIVANALGWSFVDLDRAIEEREGRSPGEIIEQSGEPAFRNIERARLMSLPLNRDAIVSLGGGAFVDDENAAWIKRAGKVAYVRLSPEDLYERLKNKTDRPLFRKTGEPKPTRDEALAKIADLLARREPRYLEADLVFEANNGPIAENVERLRLDIIELFRLEARKANQ